jgi:hypothetical protein
MARILLESFGLFAAPFVFYAFFLIFRARHPLLVAHWSHAALSWLTLAGLALAIAGMVAAGAFAPRSEGVYTPAHMENGRLAPGRFQ